MDASPAPAGSPCFNCCATLPPLPPSPRNLGWRFRFSVHRRLETRLERRLSCLSYVIQKRGPETCTCPVVTASGHPQSTCLIIFTISYFKKPDKTGLQKNIVERSLTIEISEHGPKQKITCIFSESFSETAQNSTVNSFPHTQPPCWICYTPKHVSDNRLDSPWGGERSGESKPPQHAHQGTSRSRDPLQRDDSKVAVSGPFIGKGSVHQTAVKPKVSTSTSNFSLCYYVKTKMRTLRQKFPLFHGLSKVPSKKPVMKRWQRGLPPHGRRILADFFLVEVSVDPTLTPTLFENEESFDSHSDTQGWVNINTRSCSDLCVIDILLLQTSTGQQSFSRGQALARRCSSLECLSKDRGETREVRSSLELGQTEQLELLNATEDGQEKIFYSPMENMEDAAKNMIKDFFLLKKKKAIPDPHQPLTSGRSHTFPGPLLFSGSKAGGCPARPPTPHHQLCSQPISGMRYDNITFLFNIYFSNLCKFPAREFLFIGTHGEFGMSLEMNTYFVHKVAIPAQSNPASIYTCGEKSDTKAILERAKRKQIPLNTETASLHLFEETIYISWATVTTCRGDVVPGGAAARPSRTWASHTRPLSKKIFCCYYVAVNALIFTRKMVLHCFSSKERNTTFLQSSLIAAPWFGVNGSLITRYVQLTEHQCLEMSVICLEFLLFSKESSNGAYNQDKGHLPPPSSCHITKASLLPEMHSDPPAVAGFGNCWHKWFVDRGVVSFMNENPIIELTEFDIPFSCGVISPIKVLEGLETYKRKKANGAVEQLLQVENRHCYAQISSYHHVKKKTGRRKSGECPRSKMRLLCWKNHECSKAIRTAPPDYLDISKQQCLTNVSGHPAAEKWHRLQFFKLFQSFSSFCLLCDMVIQKRDLREACERSRTETKYSFSSLLTTTLAPNVHHKDAGYMKEEEQKDTSMHSLASLFFTTQAEAWMLYIHIQISHFAGTLENSTEAKNKFPLSQTVPGTGRGTGAWIEEKLEKAIYSALHINIQTRLKNMSEERLLFLFFLLAQEKTPNRTIHSYKAKVDPHSSHDSSKGNLSEFRSLIYRRGDVTEECFEVTAHNAFKAGTRKALTTQPTLELLLMQELLTQPISLWQAEHPGPWLVAIGAIEKYVNIRGSGQGLTARAHPMVPASSRAGGPAGSPQPQASDPSMGVEMGQRQDGLWVHKWARQDRIVESYGPALPCMAFTPRLYPGCRSPRRGACMLFSTYLPSRKSKDKISQSHQHKGFSFDLIYALAWGCLTLSRVKKIEEQAWTPNPNHSGPQHAIFLLYQEINLNIILGGGLEFVECQSVTDYICHPVANAKSAQSSVTLSPGLVGRGSYKNSQGFYTFFSTISLSIISSKTLTETIGYVGDRWQTFSPIAPSSRKQRAKPRFHHLEVPDTAQKKTSQQTFKNTSFIQKIASWTYETVHDHEEEQHNFSDSFHHNSINPSCKSQIFLLYHRILIWEKGGNFSSPNKKRNLRVMTATEGVIRADFTHSDSSSGSTLQGSHSHFHSKIGQEKAEIPQALKLPNWTFDPYFKKKIRAMTMLGLWCVLTEVSVFHEKKGGEQNDVLIITGLILSCNYNYLIFIIIRRYSMEIRERSEKQRYGVYLSNFTIDKKLVNDISSRSRNSTEGKRIGNETLMYQTEGEEYERQFLRPWCFKRKDQVCHIQPYITIPGHGSSSSLFLSYTILSSPIIAYVTTPTSKSKIYITAVFVLQRTILADLDIPLLKTGLALSNCNLPFFDLYLWKTQFYKINAQIQFITLIEKSAINLQKIHRKLNNNKFANKLLKILASKKSNLSLGWKRSIDSYGLNNAASSSMGEATATKTKNGECKNTDAIFDRTWISFSRFLHPQNPRTMAVLINIIKSIPSLNLPWLSMKNIDSIYSGEYSRMTSKDPLEICSSVDIKSNIGISRIKMKRKRGNSVSDNFLLTKVFLPKEGQKRSKEGEIKRREREIKRRRTDRYGCTAGALSASARQPERVSRRLRGACAAPGPRDPSCRRQRAAVPTGGVPEQRRVRPAGPEPLPCPREGFPSSGGSVPPAQSRCRAHGRGSRAAAGPAQSRCRAHGRGSRAAAGPSRRPRAAAVEQLRLSGPGRLRGDPAERCGAGRAEQPRGSGERGKTDGQVRTGKTGREEAVPQGEKGDLGIGGQCDPPPPGNPRTMALAVSPSAEFMG
ncbi:hypothetical protein DV515_00002048 [Chloebia gouldiae]|uniref:Uncharacterized protein n=1 Tax=Chloebia gouldiae TaxID=44316 RepID=A0A3L8SVF9_CHLGU|nr:hypothetical protein DV515_00002048 [Chloebia gouldiae]